MSLSVFEKPFFLDFFIHWVKQCLVFSCAPKIADLEMSIREGRRKGITNGQSHSTWISSESNTGGVL